MKQVGHLQELHEKFFDKGLRVIAISDESAGKIEREVVESRGGTYWIGSDPSNSTFSKYAEGRVGIPHMYVVDAFGFVVQEGIPSEQRIEELLAEALDTSLGRDDLDRSLSSAVRSFAKGDWGRAWKAAGRKLDDEDETVVADARYLRQRCEEIAAWYRKAAEKAVEARDYAQALGDLERIAKEFSGMEIAGWADAREDELSSDDAVKDEIRAWQAWEKIAALQADADGNDRKLAAVKVHCERLVKRYPGTRAAERAAEAAASIGG